MNHNGFRKRAPGGSAACQNLETVAVALSAAIAIGGCGGSDPGPEATNPCPTVTGTGCAPRSKRVDLYEPTFSKPSSVTNPLLPISTLDSVVYVGDVDHKPFRTETTLLPKTTIIEYKGQKIESLTFQYMAFSDGRLEEIAVDFFAQDDLGAVFYLGEDVADYNKLGVVYTHEGTWHAGVEGPIAMNMPPVPQLGDAWLAENAAPAAWEQITVKSVDVTLDGPSGKILGSVVTAEWKLDSTGEEKIFAPGYGELSTGSLATNNLEALALAIPIDALTGAVPSELQALATGTSSIFNAAEAGDWTGASAALATVKSNWESYRAGVAVPPLLEAEMDRILVLVTTGVGANDARQARHQAIDLTRFIYDFHLRYQPSTEINKVRFDLWLAQVLVDAAVGVPGPVKGDAATLELVWDRIAHTFDAPTAAAVESGLAELRTAADAENAEQARTAATKLRASFAAIGWK